jgi:hypothetical protein
MRRREAADRGAALPLAVLALLVIGTLVAASFLLGRQELAVGTSTLRLQEALAAAEGGMQLQVALWDPAVLNTLPVGDSVTFDGSLPTGGWYRGATRRLNDLLFLVRSEGFSGDSGARQPLGVLVRLQPVEFGPTAAFVAGGATAVRDFARVDGTDRAPTDWSDCGAAQPSVAGIRIALASDVTTAGCAGPPCVTGSPDVRADPGLDSAALSTFGAAGFDDLRTRATVTVPGGARGIAPSEIGGICYSGDPDNWGSPLQPGGPCGSRFPIVWSEGDLTVTGGQGQGVLIVNGSLAVGGGFVFSGVVIVRGGVATMGIGGSVYGAVLAANAGGAGNDIAGNALLQYSDCAVTRALRRSALADPLRSRGWVGLR